MKPLLPVSIILILLLACQSSPKEQDARPNILFIISDDQSWLHVGAYGDPQINTPAFDRIAREGVLFNNSFCTSPSCTPSRSSVLTGQDIWRIREAGILYGSIPPDIPLVTHLLADHGYHVGFTGKGWAPGKWDYLGLTTPPLIKEYNMEKESHIAYGIDPRDYAANFVKFLQDRPDGAPFFFWFGPTEPHREYAFEAGEVEAGLDPSQVDLPSFWPDVPVIRTDVLDYFYEIMWYDTFIAEFLEILEASGELDNTLIVATSDNGMPFPRAKVNIYDWGTHMPLAIRWGDRLSQGRVVDDLVSHIDFAPTFLEAAGIEIPDQMTGKSLMPILSSTKSGQIVPERTQVFTGMERHTWCRPEGATYPMRAIRTHDYLYIRNFEPDRWPTGGPDFISSNKTNHGDVDACPSKSFMVAYQEEYPREYDLSFGKRPKEELYAIHADKSQVNNLADEPEYQTIKDSLAHALTSHLESSGDPRIKGEDPWQAQVYHQENNYGSTFNRLLSPSKRARAKLRPSHHPVWKLK
ncbi:MAG: sulfatase [Bacteroidota bacterium]